MNDISIIREVLMARAQDMLRDEAIDALESLEEDKMKMHSRCIELEKELFGFKQGLI